MRAVDDPVSLQAFLRCSHEARSLRVSTTLQALWLVRNRPLTSLLDAAKKAEPHLKETVMLKLLRLPCLPVAALSAVDKEKMTPLVRGSWKWGAGQGIRISRPSYLPGAFC